MKGTISQPASRPDFRIPPGQQQSPARLSPHPDIFILPLQIQTVPEGKQKIQQTRPACLQYLHALHALKIRSLLMTDFPASSISLFIIATLLPLRVSGRLSPRAPFLVFNVKTEQYLYPSQ